MYSVDTRAFYTDDEMEIDKGLSALRQRKRMLKQAANLLEQHYNGAMTEKVVRKRLKALKYNDSFDAPLPRQNDISDMRAEARGLTAQINQEKQQLCDLLDQFSGVRKFREEFIRDHNVISIFDSYLTRTLDIEPGVLTTDLVIVKTCYFKVFKDIICNGFTLHGEKYVIYTASAGQIRTKRSVFIKESRLQECAMKLMCGLTIDHINEKGGVNINKYLAYLALSNSATDPWPEFDIDKCIVVDDFETDVKGLVDYIDSATYEITRQEMEVPIPHTDGCGMVLPSVCKKNFMIRLPWVKGLLASFPFDKFVREANKQKYGSNYGVVKDIYGVEHDVLAEGIQIIFTKSQFKMWKYYSSWDEYKQYFKEYGCEAGICNMEEDVFEYAKINYQMLQTLTDLTDDELKALCSKTVEKLDKISSDRNTMLNVFGATPGNWRKDAFQEALMLYPELLQDEYCRDTLRMIKTKIEKEAIAGRLDIEGYYTFLIPDLYAFCQWLFLGEAIPSGLLQNGEVYCRLFESGVELDCLRSPHLYKEHAVRKNMFGLNDEAKRWFQTDGIYTSTYDLISRILQFDVDGDRALVVSDQTLVDAAKRNMENVVPLFYPMAKAGARQITPDAIYESMIAAYIGGNIGSISNDITKIYNSDSEIQLDAVKLLCLENNFTIDYAKTLYKPTRPDHAEKLIRSLTKSKVPYFFIEAKGKTENQVAPLNNSCVNRIRAVIPRRRLSFNEKQLGKFDWRMLVSTDRIPNNEITQKIIEVYRLRSSRMSFKFDDETDGANKYWVCQQLREELLGIHPDINYVVDVLVKYLFYTVKSKRKMVFWECFGREVVQNLRKNVDQNMRMCSQCGVRFYREGRWHVLCPKCAQQQARASKAAWARNHRNSCGNS